MSEINLKPCPHCGGLDLELYTEEDDGGYDGFIRCISCDALLGKFVRYISKEECEAAIAELWNKRINDINTNAIITAFKAATKSLNKIMSGMLWLDGDAKLTAKNCFKTARVSPLKREKLTEAN